MDAVENRTDSGTQNDIAEQSYQGPGAVVTSIGMGTIDWHVAWAASLILGVGAALSAPKQLNHVFGKAQQNSAHWRENGNMLQKAGGWVLHGWLQAGKWSNDHLPGREWLEKKLGNERWQAASMSGGIMTVLAFAGSLFTGTDRGIRSANAGKGQFAEAQNEIKRLRKQLTDLPAPHTGEMEAHPGNRIDAASAEHHSTATPALAQHSK